MRKMCKLLLVQSTVTVHHVNTCWTGEAHASHHFRQCRNCGPSAALPAPQRLEAQGTFCTRRWQCQTGYKLTSGLNALVHSAAEQGVARSRDKFVEQHARRCPVRPTSRVHTAAQAFAFRNEATGIFNRRPV